MKIGKIQLFGFVLVLFASAIFAQGTTADIVKGLTTLCVQIHEIVPVVVMLMLVGAGAIYAGGQMMGAETRARANVWATSMLVGAVIGIIIIVVAPAILQTMYGETGTIDWNTCRW